jgi:hypothetical protein
MGLLMFVAMFVITMYYMRRATLPYIRRVPAIDAIEEGIGRATELGRPVVTSPGIAIFGIDYWTVAALSMLAHIARLCARNDLRLIVPLGGSDNSYTTMEVARDIVENQYRLEGKPESFNLENLPFLSGRQFAWSSGYAGILMRNRPAANIMVGVQWGTAIYLSEVSHQVDCMMIAGTTYIANIACLSTSSDYVMIGEEQTAAGAYLSRDPVQLASIRTQDILKGALFIILVLGIIAISMGNDIVNVILGM